MKNKTQFRVKFDPDEIHDAIVNNQKEYFFQFTQKALTDLSQMPLNYNKQNTLHLCVWYNRVDILRFLLDFEDITQNILNFQDMNGETPLHLAFFIKNPLLIHILVKKGSNYLIPNRKYQQCFDLVKVEPDSSFVTQVLSYFKYECQFSKLLKQKFNHIEIQDGNEEKKDSTTISEYHNLTCLEFKEDEQDKILSELLNDPRISQYMDDTQCHEDEESPQKINQMITLRMKKLRLH